MVWYQSLMHNFHNCVQHKIIIKNSDYWTYVCVYFQAKGIEISWYYEPTAYPQTQGIEISWYYEPTVYLRTQGIEISCMIISVLSRPKRDCNIMLLWTNFISPGSRIEISWYYGPIVYLQINALKYHDIMIQLYISRTTQELKYYNIMIQLNMSRLRIETSRYYDSTQYLQADPRIEIS